MIFVKMPRITFNILNFECIIPFYNVVVTSFCSQPLEVNDIFNFVNKKFFF
jgi:hypothetical protein